jgi:hypothetical protein
MTTGEVFESIGEAAAKSRLDRSCISRAISMKRKSGGYHWEKA